MEHIVEDIRNDIKVIIYETIYDEDKYNGDPVDDAARELCTLFSTILDGLVMEERGLPSVRPEERHILHEIDGYNECVHELNAKISTIQRALKEETK